MLDGVAPILGPLLVLILGTNNLSPHSGGTNFWPLIWVRIPAPKQEPPMTPNVMSVSACVQGHAALQGQPQPQQYLESSRLLVGDCNGFQEPAVRLHLGIASPFRDLEIAG